MAVGVFAVEARRELWARLPRLHLIYVVHAYCYNVIGQHSDNWNLIGRFLYRCFLWSVVRMHHVYKTQSRQTSSQFSASHCSKHTYSNHSWRCLPQLGTKRRGEGILRLEDAETSEEDNIDSQDSNTPIDHGHLAQNCSIKIIMPAVKASVISKY